MRRILLLLSFAILAPSPCVTQTVVPSVSRGTSIRPGARLGDATGQVTAPGSISAAAARKAEALLRDQLPCLGCHALQGQGGRLGPDLTTVRTRRSASYIAAMIDDPQRIVPTAAMPRTLMLPATRALIIQYLQTRPGDASEGALPAAAVPPPAAGAPDGAALYARWCVGCHGAKGGGDGPNASALPVRPAAHNDREAMSRRPDDSLHDTIAGGGAIMNRSPRMPAFGASLSSAEVRALVAHIRTLCRCQGPAWSRDDARSP